MKRQGARQIILGFHPDLSVVVETSAAHCRAMRGCCSFASSMGPLCEWCPIGLTARFAAALKDTSVLVFTLYELLMLVR